MNSYDAGVPQIPAACITVEDAELLSRVQRRGQVPRLFMNVSTADFGLVDSRNVVADLPGAVWPDQVLPRTQPPLTPIAQSTAM